MDEQQTTPNLSDSGVVMAIAVMAKILSGYIEDGDAFIEDLQDSLQMMVGSQRLHPVQTAVLSELHSFLRPSK